MPILWALVSWIFREVVIKFVIMAAVFLVMTELLPIVMRYALPFLTGSSLSAAFSGLSPGVWFFLDVARLDYGLPLLLSSAVTVFIIRRIPVVGG